MEQQDLLLDLETEITLETASAGTRFTNYIIDLIGFYLFFFVISAVILSFGNVYQSSDLTIAFNFIGLFIYVLYYTILEAGTNGRSLGKFVTKTKAVKEEGSPITWKDAFVRSLCRIIPFEPFSAFGGHPWHDKWSNTMVVKK